VTKMETLKSKHITLTQFTATFVPFALLLSAALMAPEAPQILDNHRAYYNIELLVYYRTIFSIWLTMVFFIAAEVLFFWPGDSPARRNYWLLCWTFGFLAFAVHFYYTIGIIFHGSLREVYAKQGVVIATSNLVDFAWWGFDLVLAWFVTTEAKWIRVQRILAHIYIPLTFFVSAVVIKRGFVRGLGILMTVAILGTLAVRFVRRRRTQLIVSPSRV